MIDIASWLWYGSFAIGMGWCVGSIVMIAVSQLAKLTGDQVSENLTVLLGMFGMLIGTGFGAVIFNGSLESTSVLLSMVFTIGGLLLGYGSRYGTALDARKHPEKYTD